MCSAIMGAEAKDSHWCSSRTCILACIREASYLPRLVGFQYSSRCSKLSTIQCTFHLLSVHQCPMLTAFFGRTIMQSSLILGLLSLDQHVVTRISWPGSWVLWICRSDNVDTGMYLHYFVPYEFEVKQLIIVPSQVVASSIHTCKIQSSQVAICGCFLSCWGSFSLHALNHV